MNLGSIVKDKRVLWVGGIGGLIGLGVLWSKRGAGSSSGAAAGTDAAQSGYAGIPSGTGYFDSTSADIASQLGNFSVDQQDALQAFGDQLTSTLEALQTVPTAPSTTTTTTPTAPATLAKVNPAPVRKTFKPTTQYVSVAKYTTKSPPWNSTLSGIAKHYGTSVANLLKLNPQVKNKNVIYAGSKIRVK